VHWLRRGGTRQSLQLAGRSDSEGWPGWQNWPTQTKQKKKTKQKKDKTKKGKNLFSSELFSHPINTIVLQNLPRQTYV
jgi:hypothetical protein